MRLEYYPNRQDSQKKVKTYLTMRQTAKIYSFHLPRFVLVFMAWYNNNNNIMVSTNPVDSRGQPFLYEYGTT